MNTLTIILGKVFLYRQYSFWKADTLNVYHANYHKGMVFIVIICENLTDHHKKQHIVVIERVISLTISME